ncbi:MAG: DUF5615 family PIN-like protein [Candidatus Koribacter versatilis]|uniref:DUF5615 family PIN-like protein n=1 Tax=Candidatus Korobacter versatilis TaxID=658062 RepID=A0A932EQG5_9BACT|nr:DUF5615 family PIN-like protein [Candidatus Koribacter versatilis]
MKLLYDENLPPELITQLADVFPESRDVRTALPRQASDTAVWQFARSHGFMLATKDNDFEQLAYLRGHPPKVIWLRCGNASTSQIERLLRKSHSRILEFEADTQNALLVLP